ncbi:MAG: DNA-primase RepB domain-containing protein [Caldilineaceae bacterium]
MNTNDLPQQELSPSAQLDLALRLLECLHAGGDWWLYSRPQGRGYESDWRRAGRHGPPRASWLARDHVFFGVHPHADIPTKNAQGKKRDQRWVRGTVHNIAAVNALFAELDAKDTIHQEEWLPYYITPDVGSMEKAQARGALQKAQTAAIDAALPLRLGEYKRRALAALQAAPLRPSACWDSGGGYQAVWLLDATLPVSDANRGDVASLQKEWVRLIGGDPAASDLTRVLRLPGSTNRKPKYGPNGHPVSFIWCELELTYAYPALAALAALVEPASATPRTVYVPVGLPAALGEFAEVPDLPLHPAIDQYNAAVDLRSLLLQYGYTDAGPGRMHRPGGNTAGVQLHANNTASIYSSADPLWCGHRLTPAHALSVFEYDGDIKAMLAGLTSGQLYLFSTYAASAAPALLALPT